MKCLKISGIIILAVFSLLCGCSDSTADLSGHDSGITINMPADGTVNGYRRPGAVVPAENSTGDEMPDVIPAEGTVIVSDTADSSQNYCGNKNSKVFHKSNCSFAKNMNDENRVFFSSRDEFIENGYTPCKSCNP